VAATTRGFRERADEQPLCDSQEVGCLSFFLLPRSQRCARSPLDQPGSCHSSRGWNHSLRIHIRARASLPILGPLCNGHAVLSAASPGSPAKTAPSPGTPDAQHTYSIIWLLCRVVWHFAMVVSGVRCSLETFIASSSTSRVFVPSGT
jgi:hypothetical protein